MLNRPAQMLAIVAGGLTVAYPFVKRFVSIPQFILGAAFGWAVPMAFAAQTGETPELAWLVFGTAMIWAVIYDTFYAMVDREDDLKVGVKSTAILFGEVDIFVIAGLQLLMLIALLLIGYRADLSLWFFITVLIAGLMMAYHLWLARDRQPAGCFEAFLHNHYIGMVVFIGIVLHYTFNPTVS
jgi:4-hydroxybenzoate polyprenyltransferase